MGLFCEGCGTDSSRAATTRGGYCRRCDCVLKWKCVACGQIKSRRHGKTHEFKCFFKKHGSQIFDGELQVPQMINHLARQPKVNVKRSPMVPITPALADGFSQMMVEQRPVGTHEPESPIEQRVKRHGEEQTYDLEELNPKQTPQIDAHSAPRSRSPLTSASSSPPPCPDQTLNPKAWFHFFQFMQIVSGPSSVSEQPSVKIPASRPVKLKPTVVDDTVSEVTLSTPPMRVLHHGARKMIKPNAVRPPSRHAARLFSDLQNSPLRPSQANTIKNILAQKLHSRLGKTSPSPTLPGDTTFRTIDPFHTTTEQHLAESIPCTSPATTPLSPPVPIQLEHELVPTIQKPIYDYTVTADERHQVLTPAAEDVSVDAGIAETEPALCSKLSIHPTEGGEDWERAENFADSCLSMMMKP